QPQTLPSSLVSLTLASYGRPHNQLESLLIPGSLPYSLETLALEGSIIGRLKPGLLPSSLTSLKLDDLLSPPTLVDLPSSITSLEFLNQFNLMLGVGELPPSLQTLRFGYDYNQPFVPGVFPQSLRSLYFADGHFNQPFEINVLPPQLTSLSLMSRWNQSIIPGSWPNSLATLQFGKHYTTIELDTLPSSLTVLTYEDKSDCSFFNSFDFNTKRLILWPSTLKTMVVGNMWRYHTDRLPIAIPPSVTSMSIQLQHQDHLTLLSPSLTHLDLGHIYNSPITPGSLPSSLVNLIIGKSFNQVLPVGVLPATLADLSLGDSFNQALTTGVLPPSLTSLSLGRDYKQGLKQTSLPGTLRSLSVDSRGQTKYATLPTSSFKSDLDLLEVRTGFIWTNMVTKNKASPIKLLRIKQYMKSNTRSQANIIGPMVVSFPNVHTFDVTFYFRPSSTDRIYGRPPKDSPSDVIYRMQVRRIYQQLAIGLIYSLRNCIDVPKYYMKILDLSRYDGSRPSPSVKSHSTLPEPVNQTPEDEVNNQSLI
ncbi:hypothetical protein SAMD00019534_114990, partial [Acytostelium subglobosum LB1]|uniref:hypothetical protein n=1 Tax=Acytostelium subglobosum LB1 TaxID=1410327 RepID=UPI0006451254